MNFYSFNNSFSANFGKSCLALVLTYLLVSPVAGHGRLQIPRTRFHVVNGYDRYENDPVNYQKDVEATSYEGFVCRNDPPMQNGELKPTPTTAFAGDLFDVQWSLSALHAGDCAMYVSYDYDKVGVDKKNMQWFKIANWLDCKSDNEVQHQIKIPSWLPAGRAVFRWDWYALHQYAQGNVEFYAQCADVTVVGSDSSLQLNQVPSYSVMNMYAEKVNLASSLESERGYRQELGLAPEDVQHWMTGPPCACRYSSENGCVETSSAAKTYGFIPKSTITVLASCGASATPSPTTPTPASTPSPTEAGPAPTPIPTASGDCGAVWAKCGGEGWTGATCCTTGNVCEAQSVHYSQCVPGTGPTPTQDPTSLVAPTPSPTSAVVTPNPTSPVVSPTPNPTSPVVTPTPKPTDEPVATPSPTDSGCSQPSDGYQQCGGSGWPASQSCCIAGYYCKVTSEWYSNCHPTSQELNNTPAPTTVFNPVSSPTPQPTSGGNPVATPTPAPTPAVNPTTPAPSAQPGQINPKLNIIGYYGNSGGPACEFGNCIPRIDQIPEEYNVVVFNFLNFNSDGSIAFDIIMPHTKEELPALIQQWKSVADPWGRARHALISIGGQNGIWPAGVTAAMLESNLKAFLEHYHFDGLDVDLEGSALAGGETVAEVLEFLIAEHYILAAAPEAAQGPLTHYDSIIPKLTYLHPQFYNNGPNAVTTPYLPEITWPASFPSKWEEPMLGQTSELGSQPWWLSVLKKIGQNSNLADGQLGMLVPATEFAAGNNNIWDYQLLAADIMKHGIGHVGTWAIGHDKTANYQFSKAMGLVLGPKPTN